MLVCCYLIFHMMDKPRGARIKGFGALESCFGLVSPHQQSILFPYLQAPRVIKANSSAVLVVTYKGQKHFMHEHLLFFC